MYFVIQNNNKISLTSIPISIIGTANTPVPLKVITSVKYGTEDITATLEWVPSTNTSLNTSYTVSVENETPYILEYSLSSAQIIGLPYNTHLNVSIMARWCGMYTATTIIELHYGKLLLITVHLNNS